MSMSLARSAMPSSSRRAPSLIIAYRQRSWISCADGLRCGTPRRCASSREHRDRFGIRRALAVGAVVAVVAAAGLLAEPAALGKQRRRAVEARVLRQQVRAFHARQVADVDAGHVEHGEDAHGHAEVLQRAVDLLRRGALHHAALGLAAVGVHHAVADEAVADLGDDADLLDRLGDVERRHQHVGRGALRLHDLQQLHDVGRAEEVQADHVLRAAS